jgi:hypothetical protein
MSIDLEDEERALGEWPRRLLYVPDMTSYAWQPGNTYNGIKEPKYNAITYTWGRWRLEDNERSDVEAVDVTIDGDDWPIPRVAPEHFTADDFDLLIASATWEPGEGGDGVDFIWLDVACIAQRQDSQSNAEIGRQALIFRRAQFVYLWLTSLTSSELKETINALWWVNSEQPAKYTPYYSQANRGIVRLLSDPWFSSLWTLQEAFLRQDAYLISSDITVIPRSDDDHMCDLLDILAPCADWRWCYNRITSEISEEAETEFNEANRMIKERGLLALSSQHEISTYIAAQFRTASRVNDRIYGLQQVFRLRLGITALKPTRTTYEISELENQFGEALLLQHPIHSQMHVFTRQVPARDGWRIQSCSRELRSDAFRLPPMFDERLPQTMGAPPVFRIRESTTDDQHDFITPEDAIWRSHQNAVVLHCQFSIGSATYAPRPVTWKGLVCPLADLWRLSERVYTNVQLRRRQEAINDDIIDESEPLPIFPLFVDVDAMNDVFDISTLSLESNQALGLLERTFPDVEIQVLLLGSCWPAYTREGYKHGMFGILIIAQEEQWARIGVCQWSCEAYWEAEEMQLTTEEKLLLSGNGSRWVREIGVLGFTD